MVSESTIWNFLQINYDATSSTVDSRTISQ